MLGWLVLFYLVLSCFVFVWFGWFGLLCFGGWFGFRLVFLCFFGICFLFLFKGLFEVAMCFQFFLVVFVHLSFKLFIERVFFFVLQRFTFCFVAFLS